MKSKISALTLGVLLGIPTITFADERRDPYQEGLQKDAEAIAKMYRISPEDALRRLKLQAAASDQLVVQLKEEFKERFSGIYIEHNPVDRLVVRLKGDLSVADRKLEVDGDVLLVQFIHGQSFTKKELQEALANNKEELKKAIHDLQGMYTDDRTGEVVLDIYMKKKDNFISLDFKNTAEIILGVPVRVNAITSRLKPDAMDKVRGGANLYTPGCTTGFPVKQINTSIRGVITTGHCGLGNPLYFDGNGNSTIIIYQDGIWNGTVDVQWYTVPNYSLYWSVQVEPKFYADSDTIPRTLTGRRTQASTKVGNNVCHHGKTTGYSCGDVSATDYENAACNGETCTPTWVRVDPPSNTEPGLACFGGDSGGPWFISTIALGIHNSSVKHGPWIGACEFAVYMSTDRIDVLGLQLYYGQ